VKWENPTDMGASWDDIAFQGPSFYFILIVFSYFVWQKYGIKDFLFSD
jgi:hypothetical protein